jgi:autophagy-related protein 2
MAFFLPSYFQKRLLRYALSRLDFIETDDLDLENLGITWGQRSVIELKDVGIQITKLATLLNIPPAILVTRARIGLLRLTIPADLYASGIVAEIGGVEVQVKIQDARQQDVRSAQHRPGSGLSRGNKADRPRIDSSAMHDPGGTRRWTSGRDMMSETGLPTSENLALSFLESEPVEERRELQSIVQSRSRHLPQSVTDAGGDGMGAPGGFELPTFVANFFKGVADRLSVAIKNVSLTMEIDLPQPESESADTVRLMLKASEIDLQGVKLSDDEVETERSKRSVTVKNVELVLLSEPDLVSQMAQSSTNSSPRLSRAHTKVLPTAVKSMSETKSDPEFLPTAPADQPPLSSTRSTLSQASSKSSGSSIPAFASEIEFGIESHPDHERTSDDSASAFLYQAQSGGGHASDLGAIDNQSSAQALARMAELDSSTPHFVDTPVDGSQDLAESKLFTHDEAESMYMSAVSYGGAQSSAPKAMPGAWGSSEYAEPPSTTPTGHETAEEAPSTLQERRRDPVQANTSAKPHDWNDQTAARSGPISGDSNPAHAPPARTAIMLDPTLVAKRLFSISHFTVSLATTEAFKDETLEHDRIRQSQQRSPQQFTKRASFADDSMYSQLSSQMFASTQDLPQSVAPRRKMTDFDHEAALIRQSAAPVVDLGTIVVALDLPIGKLFVRIWQEVKPLMAFLNEYEDTKSKASEPSPLQLKVESATINVCEEVVELPREHVAHTDFTAGCCNDTDVLLQISLSSLDHHLSFDGISTLQRLTVKKISVNHKNQSVMSFVDTLNLRSSMSASAMPTSNDLLVLVQTSGSSSETDVQTKFLKLRLDLLQVDDVLSRSGGLSSLLDLGSSIASTSTIRGDSTKISPPASRRRSVRFERPGDHQRQTDPLDAAGPGKINVRIAGVSVELIGSESAIFVKSSAVKLIHRQTLFGLQIDWIDIEGPLLTEHTKGDIKLRINNTRLEYLSSPKEEDLERLLSILAPSGDKHELEQDDDIMFDTLIRQRRKGGVLRLTLLSFETTVQGLKWQKHIVKLSDELSRLSSVSKYLPEDDRPGMLTLALIKKIELKLVLDSKIGTFSLKADLAEGVHVNVPSLMAAHVTSLQIRRDGDYIIQDVVSSSEPKLAMGPPMITIRFIADEMEPTIRVKVFNLLLDYKVPTVAALIELGNEVQSAFDKSRPMSPTSSVSSSSNAAIIGSRNNKRVSLVIRDSALGLNPLDSPAKGIILLSQTTLTYTAGKNGQLEAGADLRKLSMLVCDNVSPKSTTFKNADPKMFFDESLQVQELVAAGFVPIAFLSAASVMFETSLQKLEKESTSNVEFNNGLLILETSADSTQTMIQVLSGLTPPALPSKVEKYRTEIVPIQDMLASFTGNAYYTEPGPGAGLQVMAGIEEAAGEDLPEDEPDYHEDAGEDEEDPEFMGQLWQSQSEAEAEAEADDMSESYLDSELAESTLFTDLRMPPVAPSEPEMEESRDDILVHSMLNFQEDHFSRQEAVGGTAHRWDSKQNTYGLGSDTVLQQSPLKVKVRNVHVIWHLFDGYDWHATRDSISKAVQDIEVRAAATRRPRSSSRLSPRPEDDESEIGDFLFNSIYIGIPANRDPIELTSAINREIDDMTSETGSYATTTTMTASPTRRQSGPKLRQKRLRLERGKHHKMAFELKGIAVDFILFPSGSGEVESSIDVRIQDLEIIDQLPTSTWKKFATYMQDAGEREVDTNMVHIEILNVKPVADLAASEIVLKLTVLPLRLHVDQDAVDFMTRFFEFKDDSVPVSTTPSTPPFLQRVEVNPIRLKLDFKPKRVDYGGLRSGRTTEFMNFFVLDRADMVLRRVILYGVSGFDRMGIMLNNIWSPDVRRNQLPGVLAGLAPIRSLVDVGSGVRDLVVVPMREYKKDGRIVRSIQKGALAFAKTTTKELVNLGAKLAIGTQTVLQDTEKLLGQANEQERWEDQGEDEEKKQISLYADQPLGIVQGLRGAYASLERDLLLARDAIVAVPGEVMATGSATGAAQAVLRSAPTIILRPAIGASKAVGQTLLGAGNTLDRDNYRRMQEVSTNVVKGPLVANCVLQKYKRH